ncbi:MAG: sigma-54 factor interaction domain-containing protein, partial [Myxococcales bacterium]|nr:sigma-54 factor interaction domain-containing protein [Myxococcales bacterium]
MASVWIILGKTRFPAELIESSREHGVRTASVPFDLSAEFLPDLLREQDERLKHIATGAPPEAPEFADIIHKSRVMSRLIERARRVAVRSVPVLIEGESGTGKELFAEAVHLRSLRSEGPLVKVNCAAFVETLLLSELFGHEKGAFTGALTRKKGRFELAHGGTIFLDEIGDISLNTQVSLLRVLQERSFERVGGSQSIEVDVRVIAATNRNLEEMVREGTFRLDLYYRLKGVVLELPAL